jgi:ABC-type multidrug transport system ATPase subunit
MNTLSINNLTKTYSNGVKALNNVSLEINNGLFGLLGPNGAGKSSLMRTIATLQQADSGSIFLNETNIEDNPHEIRKILGYLPQDFGVYPNISAEVLLNHFAVLKGITNRKQRKERVDHLLEQTNLYQHRKKKLGGYSGGMKQRFGIAQQNEIGFIIY